MKNKYKLIIVIAIALATHNSFSQNNISVNEYTGTMTVNIPIYNVVAGDITVPISVSYNATGHKVDEEASIVGLGWNLNAGGSINVIPRGGIDLAIKTVDGVDEFIKGYGEGIDPNWFMKMMKEC